MEDWGLFASGDKLLGIVPDDGLALGMERLYQTGLETAVVGFYRGLVKVIKALRNSQDAPVIRVVPYYFDRKDNDYKPGSVWI